MFGSIKAKSSALSPNHLIRNVGTNYNQRFLKSCYNFIQFGNKRTRKLTRLFTRKIDFIELFQGKTWYSKTWLKRTPTGPEKIVRLNQVSALKRSFNKSLLQPGPKLSVRLNQVSALEHVRFNQVLLYVCPCCCCVLLFYGMFAFT